MTRFLTLFLLVPVFLILPACIDEGGSSSDSDGSAPTDTDALAGSTTTYSFTCPSGTEGSVEVSTGACQSAQQNYAYTFSCNEVDNFASACTSYYSCAVSNSSGSYVDYYQQYLSSCASYGNAPLDETVLELEKDN